MCDFWWKPLISQPTINDEIPKKRSEHPQQYKQKIIINFSEVTPQKN